MANVKPSAFGAAITPASTTILVGELADGTAGRFTADDLLASGQPFEPYDLPRLLRHAASKAPQ